jgi:hypothetical protein
MRFPIHFLLILIVILFLCQILSQALPSRKQTIKNFDPAIIHPASLP